MRKYAVPISLLLGLALLAAACAPQLPTPAINPVPDPVADPEAPVEVIEGTLVIYSGRSETLVAPLIEQFEAQSGIDVEVRYAGTSELAATLLEEGANSPADVFFAQDPGGLGAVADAGLLAQLPADLLGAVDARFADPAGRWVGVSGRARVVVYNTAALSESDLPASLEGFTDPQWKGLIGLPPTNASFQTMVTAMRQVWGEEATRAWLEGILANEPTFYENNTAVVAAVGAGEVQVGFVNHYYLYRFLAEEGEAFPARNFFLPDGGPGSLVMPAGVGVLASAKNPTAAHAFIEFLLSPEAQAYFAAETYEYPLVPGVEVNPLLTPLAELNAIDLGLEALADLQGSVALLQQVGMLP
ncbi:MAG: iron ABC transporter substrate-binding protein [Chloroflexi bacterium]|nr:iron ABC transporter substrate-binding protein [Chloroflexota bacterium]